MIPDNSLSDIPITGQFTQAKKFDVTQDIDYEDGGIGISDFSLGRTYQIWRCKLVGNDIIIDAPEASPIVLYSGGNITNISFTFDSNLKPAVVFTQDGIPKLRWYDVSINDYVVLNIPYAKTPKLALDDKRLFQDTNRDMILAYLRNDCLCYRQQRDRFLIEYILSEPLYGKLLKIGMNSRLRMQFLLELKR